MLPHPRRPREVGCAPDPPAALAALEAIEESLITEEDVRGLNSDQGAPAVMSGVGSGG